jgi:hypothetical protein
LVLILFNTIYPVLGEPFSNIMSLIRFLFVYFLSLALATLIVKLRSHPKLGLLVKYLY